MGCGLERPVNKLHGFYTSPGAEFLLGSAEFCRDSISANLENPAFQRVDGAAGKNRTYDPALTKGVLYP